MTEEKKEKFKKLGLLRRFDKDVRFKQFKKKMEYAPKVVKYSNWLHLITENLIKNSDITEKEFEEYKRDHARVDYLIWCTGPSINE